jgi:hypothetical protein
VPVLARLKQCPNVLSAEVDRTGRSFRLRLAAGATFASLRSSLAEILGDALEVFSSEGEEWFSEENILELSLLEAKILSARWGDLAATAAGLDEDKRERLCWLLREHLSEEFIGVHQAGGAVAGWYREAFPRVFDRVLLELHASLKEAQRQAINEALLKALALV